MIDAIFWSGEEIAAKAGEIYIREIQQQVETDDNIGKMLTIDIETGEYFIDRTKSRRHDVSQSQKTASQTFYLKNRL